MRSLSDPLKIALTPREYQIATLRAEGLRLKEIALKLNVSYSTVNNHLYFVYDKLGVHNVAQLAAKLGLLNS